MSNVAIVLLRKHENRIQMLMVKQKNRDPACDNCNHDTCDVHIEYTNPAGKIEENETVREAAKREFKQETSVDLPELDMSKTEMYQERDTRIIISTGDFEIPEMNVNSDEIHSTEWVDLNKIPTLKMREIFARLHRTYEPIWRKIAQS
jgi:ADP-ribose pyrophosphatase YjhB (NUDIX family)